MADVAGTVPEGTTEIWKDKKRYLWLIGLVVPIIGVAALVLHLYTDSWIPLLLGPIIVNGVVPALDLLVGLDPSNPPEEVIEDLENDRYYRWVVYAFIPLLFVIVVAAGATFADINPVRWVTDLFGITGPIGDALGHDLVRDLALDPMTWWEKCFMAFSLGGIVGIGINTAHELGHKREEVERWLAKITLAPTFYGHFYIEHNRGHHVRVATPEDPASSRLGESYWAFIPRTVSGSLKSAWEVEAKRYQRKGTHPFHLGNDVLNAWALSFLFYGAMVAMFGWGSMAYYAITIVGAILLFEIINYVEHYGMLRQKVGPKQRYERVLPEHSWNSNNIVTNVLLYHLQRHSDHHANPTRRYQALRDFKESPALPTGYAGSLTMALFPFWWRAVMDKRVVKHLGGDVSLANIQPGKEAKYFAKFPPPETHVQHEDTFLQDQSGEVLAAKCPGCSYTYVVEAGDEHEGFAAGTAWAEIPADWFCPDCGVREKIDFVPVDPQTLKVSS